MHSPVEVRVEDATEGLKAAAVATPPYSFAYLVNTYTGCPHGCVYCYASFRSDLGIHWGDFVVVHRNLPELLRTDVKRHPPRLVCVSPDTDPYPAIETAEQITRRSLTILRAAEFPVSLLTRSPLVLRDLDVLRGWRSVDVGFSVPVVERPEVVEPRVPPLSARLRALKALRSAGVKTWASIAPILPGTPRDVLRSLLRQLRDSGVGPVYVLPLDTESQEYAGLRTREAGVRAWLAEEDEDMTRLAEDLALDAGLVPYRRFLGWREDAVRSS
jgi:DNA repair photolyase